MTKIAIVLASKCSSFISLQVHPLSSTPSLRSSIYPPSQVRARLEYQIGRLSTSSMEASNPEVEALGALSLEKAPLRDVKPARDYSARRAKKKLGKAQKQQELASGSRQSQLSVPSLRKLLPWCIDKYSRYSTP